MMNLRVNEELNGIEISFSDKPSAATIESLKAAGYRWHRVKKLWYAKNTAERMALAQAITGGAEVTTAPKAAKVETINMDGVGHKPKTAHGADFAKVMREEFKARGVKGVSVRSERGGWTDSITVTVKATADDFSSVEEMKLRYPFWQFTFDIENRDVRFISAYEWQNMTSAEREELHAQYVRKQAAKMAGVNEHFISDSDRSRYWELTTAFFKKVQCIVRIAQQWNHDNSDPMTDYYDVGYYLNIDFKRCDGFEVREKMTDQERKEYAEEVKAEEERQAAELAAWKAEQARREEECKKAEERRMASRQNIAENITVQDLTEEEQIFCSGLLGGIGKESTLDELKERADRPQEALITRAVYFDTVEAFNDFCGLFLDDFEWLEGMGGTSSEDVRISDYDQYLKLTADQRESVHFYSTNCVGVYVCGKLTLVIDPQGYNYARYVYLVTDDTEERPTAAALAELKAESEGKPAFYIPAPLADQVANIHEGQNITIYQCGGWILNNIEAERGTVIDIYPGKYAQYTGYYIELVNGGKIQKAFIRDGHEVLIYEGIKPRLPQTVTQRKVSNRMSLLLNYDELFPAVLNYYREQGQTPILDNIAR